MDNVECKSCNNTTYFYRDLHMGLVCGMCKEAAYDNTAKKMYRRCDCGLVNVKNPSSEHSSWCSSTEICNDSININADKEELKVKVELEFSKLENKYKNYSITPDLEEDHYSIQDRPCWSDYNEDRDDR